MSLLGDLIWRRSDLAILAQPWQPGPFSGFSHSRTPPIMRPAHHRKTTVPPDAHFIRIERETGARRVARQQKPSWVIGLNKMTRVQWSRRPSKILVKHHMLSGER